MTRRRRIIRPDKQGGPAQRKVAKVLAEPLSSFTAKGKKMKLKQRFAVAQAMGRRARKRG